jgi:dienelactone hydrolase
MPIRTSYVAFRTAAEPALTLAGKLNTISDAGRTAAVVICHGSDGVDGRGEFHAGALNAAGIATLEVDMWAARGTARGAAARPRTPLETLPDAFAAKAFLAAQPEVDPARIGIMGFSWGGVVTLLSATAGAQRLSGDAPSFAAHVALYPVCWAYEVVPGLSLAELTGAPVLIQAGEADTYDDPDGLDQLLARLPPASRATIRGVTHPGAGHGFDRDLPAQTIVDPFAHKGRGGPVVMEFHPEAAERARELTVDFFREAFGG